MIKSCYIHIPFCRHICSYCDFAKLFYDKSWCDRYLIALEKEVKDKYCGEILDTIYIGGGTPSSLDIEQLEKLFDIVDIFRKSSNCEITVECNIETVTEEKLRLLHSKGVNRLSIGVESANEEVLRFLERSYNKQQIIEVIKQAKKIGFSNINIDLMYAIPFETIDDLKEDLSFFLNLNVPHISTYSLMIEEHTKLHNKNITPISEELDYLMYQAIHDELSKNGYCHYEISNFSKEGFQSKHNLTYWRNEEYYGFGLGASGYQFPFRYSNTRNFFEYEKGNYLLEKEEMTRQLDMENEIILGFRTKEGISKKRFQEKFGFDLKTVFDIESFINTGQIIENKDFYTIPFSCWYTSNEILVHFIGE